MSNYITSGKAPFKPITSVTHPSRSLNSSFIPSSTKTVWVKYAVSIVCAAGVDAGLVRLLVNGSEVDRGSHGNDLGVTGILVSRS